MLLRPNRAVAQDSPLPVLNRGRRFSAHTDKRFPYFLPLHEGARFYLITNQDDDKDRLLQSYRIMEISVRNGFIRLLIVDGEGTHYETTNFAPLQLHDTLSVTIKSPVAMLPSAYGLRLALNFDVTYGVKVTTTYNKNR